VRLLCRGARVACATGGHWLASCVVARNRTSMRRNNERLQHRFRASHVLQLQHAQRKLQGAAPRLGTGQRAAPLVPRGVGGRLSRGSGARAIYDSVDGRVALPQGPKCKSRALTLFGVLGS
jgi:4'-phosphopantetheinyl transferase EntD